jgi:hypothetical protein
MKYLFLLFIGASLLACNVTDKKPATPEDKEREQRDAAAMKDTANYTTIAWIDSTTQQLGEIKEGQKVELTWKFKNVGEKPLIIENVSASCGCTVASKPLEPVAPGAEGIIKATFDSEGKLGHQDKHLTVYANIKNHNNGGDTQLNFVTDVKE